MADIDAVVKPIKNIKRPASGKWAGQRKKVGKKSPNARGGPPARRQATNHLKRMLVRRQAFEMKVQGDSYPQIADALSVSLDQAWNLVMQYAQELDDETRELAAKFRQIEGATLDAAQRLIWPILEGDMNIINRESRRKLQIQAAEKVMKLSQRRAALFGLDLQRPEDVQTAVSERPYSDMSESQLDERIQHLRGIVAMNVNVNVDMGDRTAVPQDAKVIEGRRLEAKDTISVSVQDKV